LQKDRGKILDSSPDCTFLGFDKLHLISFQHLILSVTTTFVQPQCEPNLPKKSFKSRLEKPFLHYNHVFQLDKRILPKRNVIDKLDSFILCDWPNIVRATIYHTSQFSATLTSMRSPLWLENACLSRRPRRGWSWRVVDLVANAFAIRLLSSQSPLASRIDPEAPSLLLSRTAPS